MKLKENKTSFYQLKKTNFDQTFEKIKKFIELFLII